MLKHTFQRTNTYIRLVQERVSMTKHDEPGVPAVGGLRSPLCSRPDSWSPPGGLWRRGSEGLAGGEA
jgi:hypothetical protein